MASIAPDDATQVKRLLKVVPRKVDRTQLEAEEARELAVDSARWRHLYESILANTPDLGYIFDLNHRFIYANNALLAMWGRTWDEAIGKNCLELGYEPWHAAMHDREIEQVIATRQPVRGEVAFNGTNGRHIYDYIFFPVTGPTGEVEAVAGSTRDITERKRAQVLSECQRKTLQSLAEDAPLREVLSNLVEMVERYCGDAMRGSILPLDETGTRFLRGIGPSLPDALNSAVEGVEVASRIGTCCHAVLERAPVVAADVAADPKWERFAAFIAPFGLRASWSTPIVGSDGKTLGTFANYYNKPCDPTPQDMELVEIVIRMAAVAIERRAAEAKLQESEERFRAIVDTTPECVKLVASDGTLLYMNAQGLAMLNTDSAVAVVGKSIYDLIAPEHREIFRSFNERVCAGERGSIQFDMVGLDGQRRSMETHAAPFRKPNGEIVQLGLTRDITEHKLADQAIRESEKRYRELLDALPVAVYTTDAEGRITLYNASAAKFAGREAALGTDRWCVTHRLYRADGKFLPHEECPMAVSLLEGKEQRGMEAIAERPDGTRTWFVPHPTLMRDATGEITGGINVLVDITERKQAEEALRETEQRLAADLADTLQLQRISSEFSYEESPENLYEKVLDAAVAIMRSDFGSMQMYHPERGKAGELRLLAHRGFNPQAAKFWEWVRADSGCTCGATLRSGRRTVVPDMYECDWMAGTADLDACRKAGIRAAQTTPLISRGGKLLGMISTHWRDVHQPSERDLRMLDIVARQAADLIERRIATERQRRSEEALLKSEKLAAAGRMAATISHEINNPLEAITNLWYLLGEENLSPEGEQRLTTLGEELSRVSHITKQTLEFYRQGNTAARVELSDPIDAAVSLLSRKAELKGTVIETDYRTSATLFGFAGELRQLFANLISNAIEAGATAIKIRVSPGQGRSGDRRGVYVLVADNGGGVPAGAAARVFEPFFTTKEEKGTGLGPWVSKGIVQKHDGWVRARSSVQPDRSGTTFRIFLPVMAEEKPLCAEEHQ